jgi:hypothetical protein
MDLWTLMKISDPVSIPPSMIANLPECINADLNRVPISSRTSPVSCGTRTGTGRASARKARGVTTKSARPLPRASTACARTGPSTAPACSAAHFHAVRLSTHIHSSMLNSTGQDYINEMNQNSPISRTLRLPNS